MNREYILNELKKGGYLAKYTNYASVGNGKYLTGSTLQGVCLMDKNGRLLMDVSFSKLDELLKIFSFKEVEWSHDGTNSRGVEYYLIDMEGVEL